MDVYFTSTNGVCNQFMNGTGQKEEVSIVVAPLRVEGTESDRLKVISGCNMWLGCQNPDCFYSAAARSAPKK